MHHHVASPRDQAEVDHRSFARDLKALRRELFDALDHSDFEHLQKIERWGRRCTAVGYATAWIAPNPISALLISQGNLTRWTLMHHIGHRGYDKVPGIPKRYTSKGFAVGRRRWLDWFDWIVPEAWNLEHNVLHHYNTGEDKDPDLIERNLEFLRRSNAPMWRRYLAVGALAATWKISYYAPNTLHEYHRHHTDPNIPYKDCFDPRTKIGAEFWRRCFLPYATARFAAVPMLFAPLGPTAVVSVFLNSLFAEVITNLHAFLVIGPNHTGDDLYRFDEPAGEQAEFYTRQVLGSANYTCGGDVNDWAHAWLNYQIEHHLFPDLPMSSYQKAQARVKDLCARHGLEFRQDSVFKRARKMLDVMVGKTSMRRVAALTR